MPTSSQTAPGTTGLACALIAALAYPLAPGFLYRMAHAAAGPLHMPALLLGVAGVAAAPIIGIALLWKSSGSNDSAALRARAAGMLLVITPTLWVMSGSVAAALHMGSPRTLWTGIWLVAAAGLWLRGIAPKPVLPVVLARRILTGHRLFVVVLVAFAVTHLIVNLQAWQSLDAYNEAAAWFRGIYRTSIAEPILIALLVLQFSTGLALAINNGAGRSNFDHLVQVAAGLVLGTFLISHVLAVVVLGRSLLNAGPDFTFASAGPGGVLASGQGAGLAPYYTLAVIALAAHLARPLKRLVQPATGPGNARLIAGTLVVVGVVVAGFLLDALLAPGGR